MYLRPQQYVYYGLSSAFRVEFRLSQWPPGLVPASLVFLIRQSARPSGGGTCAFVRFANGMRMANVSPDKRIARSARFPALVASVDPGGMFRHDVEEACRPCGARALHLTDGSNAANLAASRACAAAIVALASPETADAKRSVVTELQASGLCVITHAAGVNQWPVSTRCEVLLAGARYLLDNREPRFRQTLTATLAEVLAAVNERRGEESQLRSAARAHGIVGESEPLLEAFRNVVRMSKLSDLPVLITGESGTGKELFASVLHALDPKRSAHPLVAVNCAAINAGIAESELFGHVRGRLHRRGPRPQRLLPGRTGRRAVPRRDRRAEPRCARRRSCACCRSGGSTASGPATTRRWTSVSSPRPTRTSAQHGQGRRAFRADLFHRLNTLSVHISPLRERKEDLPAAGRALRVGACVVARAHTGIDADLIDALSRLELRATCAS